MRSGLRNTKCGGGRSFVGCSWPPALERERDRLPTREERGIDMDGDRCSRPLAASPATTTTRRTTATTTTKRQQWRPRSIGNRWELPPSLRPSTHAPPHPKPHGPASLAMDDAGSPVSSFSSYDDDRVVEYERSLNRPHSTARLQGEILLSRPVYLP